MSYLEAFFWKNELTRDLPGDSSFNFKRFDILWASNGHFYQKLQPFEAYKSTWSVKDFLKINWGSTWSASVLRIKFIRVYLADQLDPQVAHGSSWFVTYLWINFLHNKLADQLQINYNIFGSHYNKHGSNNVSWVHDNRFKCSQGIFVFLLWSMGAPSNTLSQLLNYMCEFKDMITL